MFYVFGRTEFERLAQFALKVAAHLHNTGISREAFIAEVRAKAAGKQGIRKMTTKWANSGHFLQFLSVSDHWAKLECEGCLFSNATGEEQRHVIKRIVEFLKDDDGKRNWNPQLQKLFRECKR